MASCDCTFVTLCVAYLIVMKVVRIIAIKHTEYLQYITITSSAGKFVPSAVEAKNKCLPWPSRAIHGSRHIGGDDSFTNSVYAVAPVASYVAMQRMRTDIYRK